MAGLDSDLSNAICRRSFKDCDITVIKISNEILNNLPNPLPSRNACDVEDLLLEIRLYSSDKCIKLCNLYES
ncbi:MAG: hypothetical protein LBS71_02455 [Puniceicoccales bacterium]|nr:hypothetical protein [Puniceicoccales bacterium]